MKQQENRGIGLQQRMAEKGKGQPKTQTESSEERS